MIYTFGHDTIATTNTGKYRAHRQACWWVGDYATLDRAKEALTDANSLGATPSQRGVYDGGTGASDAVRAVHIGSA